MLCAHLLCTCLSSEIFSTTTNKIFSPCYLPSGNLAGASNLILLKLNLASQFLTLSYVPCPLVLVTVTHLPGSNPLTSLCIPLASKAHRVDLFVLLVSASFLTLLCLSSGPKYLYLGMLQSPNSSSRVYTLFPLLHHKHHYYQIHFLVSDLLTYLILFKILYSFNSLTAVISYVVSRMKSCPETLVCQGGKSRLFWSHQGSILDHCLFCLHNTQNSAEEILNKCQLPDSCSHGSLKFSPSLLFLSWFPLIPTMYPTDESRELLFPYIPSASPHCLLLVWVEFFSV